MSNSFQTKILVIVPAFNEQETIRAVIEAVQTVQLPLDIVVVNDASTDNTAREVVSQDVVLLDLAVNLGIGGAVQTGFLYAIQNGYHIAIQVDGDGQHDPSFIFDLVQEIQEGSDIVIGSRFCDKGNNSYRSTFFRRVGIRFLRLIIYLLSRQHVTDPSSGFRALNQKAFKLFSQQYPQDYPEPESLLIAHKHGLVVAEVPVVMSRRQQGSSSITALRSVYYMLKVTLGMFIIAFSLVPRKTD